MEQRSEHPPRALVHGKVRLLASGNRRLTVENPSGASGSGGKLARAFAEALGRKEGVTADTKETIALLLHRLATPEPEPEPLP